MTPEETKLFLDGFDGDDLAAANEALAEMAALEEAEAKQEAEWAAEAESSTVIEEPETPTGQPGQPDDDAGDPDVVVDDDDPLADIRGLTAEEIDAKMNKQPMREMIEAETGTKPPNSTRAPELADILYELTQRKQA